MAGIRYEEVHLPNGSEGKLAFVLHNAFTHEECSKYIEKTEEMGYTKALINIGYGRQVLMTDVRNSSRCIWDSFEEAGRIWNRIREFIPEVWNNRKVLCLNERLRFLRYDPGEFFLPHMDGSYMRENGERSYITVQLYLNEGFQGGSTTFLGQSEKDRVEVVPKTGVNLGISFCVSDWGCKHVAEERGIAPYAPLLCSSVLVFQHDIYHEGSLLKEGRKYAMRTDVMYEA